MTVRKQRMLDDLSQVAQDIINFILKPHLSLREQNKHISGLAAIMKEIEDEFGKPILTSWSMLYRVYRQYATEQGMMYTEVPSLDDQILILDVITHFLKHGTYEVTNAHILLLDLLIEKVNKYLPLDSDERLTEVAEIKETLCLGIKLLLRNAFIQHAKERLASFKPQINPNTNIINLNTLRP